MDVVERAPETPALDAAVAGLRALPSRRTRSPWVAAVAAGLVVASQVLGLLLGLVPGLLGWFAAVLIPVAVLVVGVARITADASSGTAGAGAALGLDRPRARDLPRAVLWLVLGYAAQVAVGIVAVAVGLQAGRNVADFSGAPAWALVVVCVVVVGVAPVVEEILFRGLVLRGLMGRLSFWPSALLCSGLFGLLHAPTALAGAPALVLQTAALGLVLCLLARRTGRLAPGMLVHALHNAVGLAAAFFLL